MANTDKHQPDDQQWESSSKQKAHMLTRDLDDLQKGLRIDFDQKLSELAGLLARFKAIVVAPGNNAANDNAIDSVQDSHDRPDIDQKRDLRDNVVPILSNVPQGQNAEPSNPDPLPPQASDAAKIQTSKPSASINRYAPEPARFESGLYKLNSQLYRFRLELDQEMEFREEPLHIHFRQKSELSLLLQKISDKSSEKHPDN